MAKLIFKWRYIKPGTKQHNSNLVKYIATRPNVDKIADRRDNYVRYISYRPGAERFGAHGLFSDANVPIDLDEICEEVANHPGVLMTEVLSLRREDAVRLGYDRGCYARNMPTGITALTPATGTFCCNFLGGSNQGGGLSKGKWEEPPVNLTAPE